MRNIILSKGELTMVLDWSDFVWFAIIGALAIYGMTWNDRYNY